MKRKRPHFLIVLAVVLLAALNLSEMLPAHIEQPVASSFILAASVDVPPRNTLPAHVLLQTAAKNIERDLRDNALSSFEIHSSSGDVIVHLPATEHVLTGTVATGSGDVTLQVAPDSRLRIDEIRTGSGTIHVVIAAGSNVFIDTIEAGSGAINFTVDSDVMLMADIQTGSGTVSLDMLPDAALDLDFSSSSGRLITQEQDLSRYTAPNVQNGQITLDVQTGSGSMTVR